MGHVRVCNIKDIKKYSDYDVKLLPVRSPAKFDYTKYGLIHVPELAPSEALFFKYIKYWKNNIFTEKEREIIKRINGSWFDLYKKIFDKELNLIDASINFNRIIELANEGKKILLVCFCPSLKKCHLSIIKERLELNNILVKGLY